MHIEDDSNLETNRAAAQSEATADEGLRNVADESQYLRHEPPCALKARLRVVDPADDIAGHQAWLDAQARMYDEMWEDCVMGRPNRFRTAATNRPKLRIVKPTT